MKVLFYCTSRNDEIHQPGPSKAAETEEDKKQSAEAMPGAEDDEPAEREERQEQSAPYRSVVEDEPAETKEQVLKESGQEKSEDGVESAEMEEHQVKSAQQGLTGVKDGSAETKDVAAPPVAIRVYVRRRKGPVLVYQRRRKGHKL
jgi:hypothetical protein